MGHDEYLTSEVARHHRAVIHDLERVMPEGWTRSEARLGETCGMLSVESFATEAPESRDHRLARIRVWMRDSILWTLESWARGHYVETMRGYAQARCYEGTLQGLGEYPHNVVTSDALSLLRNLCERMVDPWRACTHCGKSRG